jgi:hypothetical protein
MLLQVLARLKKKRDSFPPFRIELKVSRCPLAKLGDPLGSGLLMLL